jgi:hypothetical protein
MDLRLRSRMLRCAAALGACLLAGASAAAAADAPAIESAAGLSRAMVRVTFAAPVPDGALRAADFTLSMGNEARRVTAVAFGDDRRTATLRSASSWMYGTAGSVAVPGHPAVRVWASPGDAVAPVLRRVRLNRKVLCTRASSRNCARSGGTVRFHVDEPVTIVLDLRKRGSAAPSTEKHPTRAGAGRIDFYEKIEGLRLRPGRFVLTVTAVDAAGNESKPVPLPLRVRR